MNGVALSLDPIPIDTQMSLATAVGCIRSYQRWRDRGIYHSASVVHRRYLDWLESQNDRKSAGTGGIISKGRKLSIPNHFFLLY